jgi:hypothetical protein
LIWYLLAVALVAIGLHALSLLRQSARYEALIDEVKSGHAAIVARLEDERDHARNEAKVYRGLLIPAITRSEAKPAGAAGSAIESPTSTATASGRRPASAASTRSASRVPFRNLFNAARRMTNTKQQRTDALANALQTAREFAAQKSVEEKSNE